jgi:hypothetical protein
MTEESATIGVAMVGYGFMGAVHSHAGRTAHRFLELPHRPRMVTAVPRPLQRGALGSFEATRFAADRKNAIRIEINGHAEVSRSTSRT